MGGLIVPWLAAIAQAAVPAGVFGPPRHNPCYRGGWTWKYYIESTGYLCCEGNSVGADVSSWFRVVASRMEVDSDGVAAVTFSLFAGDYSSGRWKRLRWSSIGLMHGRHIHVSAVTHDLRRAWHVHPEPAPGSATEFVARLQLPPPRADDGALRVRLLVSFGVLADEPEVNMCVSETSAHYDPAPGVPMTVQGEAATELLTLRAGGGGGAAGGMAALFGAARSVTTLALVGADSDEVAGNLSFSRELEAGCTADPAAAEGCWGMRLSVGAIRGGGDLADFRERLGRARGSSRMAVPLFEAAAEPGGEAAGVLADGAPIDAPSCVGFSAFVRRGGVRGEPAHAAFAPYLTMGGHAILSRLGGESMAHIHFGGPHHYLGAADAAVSDAARFHYTIDNPWCAARMEAAPAAASFGPSLVGAWRAKDEGVYAIYILLKRQAVGEAARLVAPSFFFRIGRPPADRPPAGRNATAPGSGPASGASGAGTDGAGGAGTDGTGGESSAGGAPTGGAAGADAAGADVVRSATGPRGVSQQQLELGFALAASVMAAAALCWHLLRTSCRWWWRPRLRLALSDLAGPPDSPVLAAVEIPDGVPSQPAPCCDSCVAKGKPGIA